MAVQVRIPASYVSSGWGTPTVCARHGEPAVTHERTRFVSRLAPYSYLLLLLGLVGLVILAIVAATTRDTVKAGAWPYCVRCQQRHVTVVSIGAGLLGGGALLGGVVGTLFGDSERAVGAGLPLSFLMIVAGMIVLILSTWAGVAGGLVSDNGQTVFFPQAHEAFAAQAMAAQQAAAHHYAAQVPTQPA